VIRVKRNLLPVILLLSILSSQATGQTSLRPADLRVIQGTPLEREFTDMLLNYMVHQAADSTMKRLTRFDAIQSQENFKDWQEINRTKFIELIGGLPGKPGDSTPLNARVVGEIPRDGYVVRKVIFESLPEFYVTANLYVPTVGVPPFPAVLAPCGHSKNGKAYDVYQHLFIGLAKRGYVVLAYDPIGQGERAEYWDFVHQRNFLPDPDDQHAMAGIQEYLIGQDLARYFIWDGMRGIDYLASLKEVDPKRIGVTGSSGGGTLTTYISMLDPRVKAASIVCFITSLPKKIEARANDADSDPEQDIPGLLAAGLDHTEFVGMIAPRPVLIGAATQDFFPIDGTRRTFRELQRLYALLGASDRLKMVEANQRHAYSQPFREATYAWFDRWLKGAGGEAVHEPAITTEKDATLECTPNGQVFTAMGGKRVYDFNHAEAQRLADRLDLERRPNSSATLATRIAERLGSQSGAIQAGSARVGETTVGNLVVQKVLLTTEPGIVVPTRVVYQQAIATSAAGQPVASQAAPESARRAAVVYLRDRDGADDDPAIIERLAQQGELVAVADVRGFGETKSARSIAGVSYFDARNGMDADFAYDSFFLGRPLVGMRVRDARAVVRWVAKRPDVDAHRISIIGRGWAGGVALFAAALEPDVAGVAVTGVPVSFVDIAQAELYQQPASLMLPGVLRDFDLVDAMGSLAPRPLLLLNPQDALTRKLEESQATHALRPVHDAYREKGATAAFEVRTAPFESDVEEALEKWILAR